jgi:hypothetical protein
LTDPKIFLTLLALAAIAAIAVLYLALRKEQKSKEVVTSEWQPTGKIDFHCVDTPKEGKVPAAFLLRVEVVPLRASAAWSTWRFAGATPH